MEEARTSAKSSQAIWTAAFIGASSLTLAVCAGLLLAPPSSLPSPGPGVELFAPVAALASLVCAGALASWRGWITRSPEVFTVLGVLAVSLLAAVLFTSSALDALSSMSDF